MEMEWEKQGYQIQILVGDGYLTGSLRCTMDPIEAFTLHKNTHNTHKMGFK